MTKEMHKKKFPVSNRLCTVQLLRSDPSASHKLRKINLIIFDHRNLQHLPDLHSKSRSKRGRARGGKNRSLRRKTKGARQRKTLWPRKAVWLAIDLFSCAKTLRPSQYGLFDLQASLMQGKCGWPPFNSLIYIGSHPIFPPLIKSNHSGLWMEWIASWPVPRGDCVENKGDQRPFSPTWANPEAGEGPDGGSWVSKDDRRESNYGTETYLLQIERGKGVCGLGCCSICRLNYWGGMLVFLKSLLSKERGKAAD